MKYILYYCLTRLDAIGNAQIHVHHTLNEAATEDPVQNDTAINTNDTTELTNTAASNDENNVDMQYVTASATAVNRSVDDDSSDEESRPNAKKTSAPSSPASKRPDTAVSKERERRDLPRNSTFPSAPKSGEQKANRRSFSPIRPPKFYKIINMAHNYIIQWNCKGIIINKEDIEWLISKYAPAAICLQETLLKPEHTPTFKHYTAYYKSNI